MVKKIPNYDNTPPEGYYPLSEMDIYKENDLWAIKREEMIGRTPDYFSPIPRHKYGGEVNLRRVIVIRKKEVEEW